MIRQVITCNICGTQKQQTNHWFLAREESGELHISGWNPSHLLTAKTKHLCGVTCAHKLISQFLMNLVSVETQRSADYSDNGPASKGRIMPANGVAPLPLTWHSLPSGDGTPAPPDYARVERRHQCGGRRT